MKQRLVQIGLKISLILVVGVMLFPIFYITVHAFKSPEDIVALYNNGQTPILHKVWIKPFVIDLTGYYNIFLKTSDFLKQFWNTLFIVMPIIVGQLVVGTLAAYSFSKLKVWFGDKLFYAYIVVMLMPFQVTLVPNYIIIRALHLMDSYGALILPGIFGTFSVFFLKQFMDGIDEAYLESARLEGASEMSVVCKIIIPMCKPILVVTAVLLFVDYWNMVEQPLVFLTHKSKYPLSLFLLYFEEGKIVGESFAYSVFYMILPIFVALGASKDLDAGLSIVALK